MLVVYNPRHPNDTKTNSERGRVVAKHSINHRRFQTTTTQHTRPFLPHGTRRLPTSLTALLCFSVSRPSTQATSRERSSFCGVVTSESPRSGRARSVRLYVFCVRIWLSVFFFCVTTIFEESSDRIAAKHTKQKHNCYRRRNRSTQTWSINVCLRLIPWTIGAVLLLPFIIIVRYINWRNIIPTGSAKQSIIPEHPERAHLVGYPPLFVPWFLFLVFMW